MPTSRQERIAFALMLLTAPAVVYALTLLRPTFDDWTYTTYPNTDPDFWKYLLPYGDYWRPFDGAFGYVVAMGDRWFPTLNHLCVYLGHALATLWVWLIARRLDFHPAARLTAATIHYVSPAILGTLLSIDSLNQTYASCWGLAALWVYLSGKRHAIPSWLLLCATATLCKENGAMWLFISPWVGWLFNKVSGRQACRHLAWAMGLLIVYGTLRLALPNSYEKEESEYFNIPLAGRLSNVAKYVLLSYTSFDFVSVFHRPSRNVPYLLLTLTLSAPYFALNLLNAYRRRCDRRLWGLLAASLVAVAPHLLTLFSTMHAYAGLAPLALLAGWLMPKEGNIRRTALGALILYVVSASRRTPLGKGVPIGHGRLPNGPRNHQADAQAHTPRALHLCGPWRAQILEFLRNTLRLLRMGQRRGVANGRQMAARTARNHNDTRQQPTTVGTGKATRGLRPRVDCGWEKHSSH